ncbi:MAG: hypothetical protein AAF297_08005 [Planctomycetota bacterium]
MASQFGTSGNAKDASAPGASRCRTLRSGVVELQRGRHVWRFELCDSSRASTRRMLETLAMLAESRSCPLDWFDAAQIAETLSHTKPHGTDGSAPTNSNVGPTSGREDETVAG